jgi:2-keto-4-pentenoate hydratase
VARQPLTALDPRLEAALRVQLAAWRAALDGGAARIGWKVGAGDRERMGGGVVLGHLTSATVLRPGATFDDYAQRVAGVARLLGAMGEPLRPGDRIITGSIVQVPVAAGERVAADLGPLGRVELAVG